MKNLKPYVTFQKTKSGNQKGAWRFTIKAANGETQATSEGYTSKDNAQRGFADLVASVLRLIIGQ